MPKFDSPIGSKQFQGQPMRDISVPDDSGYEQPPMPRQMRRGHHDHSPPVFDEQAMQEFQASMQAPVTAPRDMSDFERDILAAKKAKREGKERLSEGAKRRIEMLVGMTRLTRNVDVNGTIFVLQTLKNIEVRESLVAAMPYDGTIEFSFENAKQTLARSLIQIAGTDVDQFLGSSSLEARLAFMEELPQSLFTRLYDEYAALDTESKDKFSIKTDTDVKGVLEDLKK